jgi:exodeoxyribonuclease-3
VGLHLRKDTFPEKPDFSHPEFDHETRIVVAQVEDLVFASIYVPNGGKDFPAKMRFLEAMELYVRQQLAAGKRLVLCGDINIARTEKDVHPTMRNPNQIGQTEGERQVLERILGEGLVDLSRQFEPDNDRLFTWWAPWRNMRQRNMGWRLDYVMVSPSLARKARSCVALREFGTSDHGPVTALFEDPVLRSTGKAGPEPEPEPAEAGETAPQLALPLGEK